MRNKTRDERDAQVTMREVAADIKDRSKETRHRVAAEGEHAKRAVFGDAMTTSEKLTSVAKETGHKTAAAADKAKRKVRDRVRK